MAMRKIVGMRGRERRVVTKALVPAIGGRREMRIERTAQLLHQGRQGIGKVAIFAAPEAMPRHHHRAAEAIIPVIERSDAREISSRKKAGQYRPALPVKRGAR